MHPNRDERSISPVNWIFICPADNRPVGGNKVIYRSSEYLCSMGCQSEVFHPRRINYRGKAFRAISLLSGKRDPYGSPNNSVRLGWFDHNANICRRALNPEKDILIIPEVMVLDLAPRAEELGYKYCIYALNGYLIDSGIDRTDRSYLDHLYSRAECVLSISENTSVLIEMAYPSLVGKIFRVFINTTKPVKDPAKENLITYMPRKLSLHSKKCLFFLRKSLPSNWQIRALDGLTESELRSVLTRSKIFLSFSELEGFGLPPYEAALLGNLVVGYSGSGGDEFFREPVFRKVESGDLVAYINEIRAAISDWDRSESVDSLVLSPASWLTQEYGDARVNRLWQDAVAFVNKSFSTQSR